MTLKKLFFGLMVLLLAGIPATAFAHGSGGTRQLNLVQAGPYQVSMWTEPEPLAAGVVHFNIIVSTPANGDFSEAGPPVLDATVTVILTPVAGGETISIEAGHDTANKLFYTADTNVPSPGEWNVTISIDGAEGHGETSITLFLEKNPTKVSWIWIGAGVALVAAAGFFFVRQLRSGSDGS